MDFFPSDDSTSSSSSSTVASSPNDNDEGDTGSGDTGSTTVTNPLGVVGPKNYTQLVWYDEFDEGSVPNSTKWSYDLGSPLLGGTVWGNSENQHYTNDSKNSYISDGNLVIQAIHETPAGASWGVFASSARLTTTTDDYWEAIGNSGMDSTKFEQSWLVFEDHGQLFGCLVKMVIGHSVAN